MPISEEVKAIKLDLKLIGRLEKKYSVVPNNSDNSDPTLYVGVAETLNMAELTKEVEGIFDEPYKKAGDSAFFKNLFDSFVKSVGGVRKEQTLYRKRVTEGVFLYCAFWPWGSKPEKTSIRIGLICATQELDECYAKELKGYF